MVNTEGRTFSSLIKGKAFELGFDLCGIARSRPLTEHLPKIREWCSTGMNADMSYLGREPEKRIDPGSLVPDARSVIVMGLNYYTPAKQRGDRVPVISRYAYGVNYHDVILEKLGMLTGFIKTLSPGANTRSFVDSSPLLEKAWASEAGLGWPGRHSVLINDAIGSFFFIGVIILDLELEYDKPFERDLCGNCRLCIDACPSSAINPDRTINARRCIAFQTIESKSAIAEDIRGSAGGRVFGCDACQEACPWNSRAREHNTPEFTIPAEVAGLSADEWLGMTKDTFKRLFKRSAIGRKKYETFMENVTIVTKS
jgi:epoxyqueuosine reductase